MASTYVASQHQPVAYYYPATNNTLSTNWITASSLPFEPPSWPDSSPIPSPIQETPMSKSKLVTRLNVGTGTPVDSENAGRNSHLLATDAVRSPGGFIGQVLVFGDVVWQSEVLADDDDATGFERGLAAAQTKINDTLTRLFGDAPSQPVGFTPAG